MFRKYYFYSGYINKGGKKLDMSGTISVMFFKSPFKAHEFDLSTVSKNGNVQKSDVLIQTFNRI